MADDGPAVLFRSGEIKYRVECQLEFQGHVSLFLLGGVYFDAKQDQEHPNKGICNLAKPSFDANGYIRRLPGQLGGC